MFSVKSVNMGNSQIIVKEEHSDINMGKSHIFVKPTLT